MTVFFLVKLQVILCVLPCDIIAKCQSHQSITDPLTCVLCAIVRYSVILYQMQRRNVYFIMLVRPRNTYKQHKKICPFTSTIQDRDTLTLHTNRKSSVKRCHYQRPSVTLKGHFSYWQPC